MRSCKEDCIAFRFCSKPSNYQQHRTRWTRFPKQEKRSTPLRMSERKKKNGHSRASEIVVLSYLVMRARDSSFISFRLETWRQWGLVSEGKWKWMVSREPLLFYNHNTEQSAVTLKSKLPVMNMLPADPQHVTRIDVLSQPLTQTHKLPVSIRLTGNRMHKGCSCSLESENVPRRSGLNGG